MVGHPTQQDERRATELRDHLRRDGNDVSTLVHLGALMFEPYHRFEESVSLLRKALDVDRTNVAARFWLAKCFFHLRADAESAQQVLAEALEIDPNRPECLSLMVSVLQDLGQRPAQYVELLRRAVLSAPSWTTPRQQLVQALIELDDLDEADCVARQSIDAIEVSGSTSDSVEEYFESAVTGRGWPKAQDELRQLITAIERRRARRTSDPS